MLSRNILKTLPGQLWLYELTVLVHNVLVRYNGEISISLLSHRRSYPLRRSLLYFTLHFFYDVFSWVQVGIILVAAKEGPSAPKPPPPLSPWVHHS